MFFLQVLISTHIDGDMTHFAGVGIAARAFFIPSLGC